MEEIPKLEEKNTDEIARPDFLKMYDIPGSEEINSHSYERYLRDKERGNKKIEELTQRYQLEQKEWTERWAERRKEELNGNEIQTPVEEKPKEKMIEKPRLTWEQVVEKEKRIYIESERICLKILSSFEGGDVEKIKEALKQIEQINLEHQMEILKKILDFNDETLFQTFIELFKIPNNFWDRSLSNYIKNDVEVKNKIIKIIETKLKSKETNEDEARLYIKAISLLEGTRLDLRALALEHFPNLAVEPPLYKRTSLNKDQFARTKFSKSGWETILLGGELKEKTILRKIGLHDFLCWQHAYEAHEFWSRNGFDYVPIEPIQSFIIHDNGMVDVYAGVLDLNLETWLSYSTLYEKELQLEKEKIKELVGERAHTHSHDRNFCLRFFRDEKGIVDLNKKPRLYLIDFDSSQAIM